MSHTRDHSVTRSLEWKLPLLISGLVLGVVLLYCWAAYREMRSSSVSAATEHLGEAAIELARLSGGIAGPRVRGRPSQNAVQQLLASGPNDSAETLLRHAVGPDSSLRAIELWSAGGERRFYTGEAASPLDSIRLHQTINEAARSDSLRRSPLYMEGGRIWFWSVRPVSAVGQQAIGQVPGQLPDRPISQPIGQPVGQPIGFVAERRQWLNPTGDSTQSEIRRLTGQEDVSILLTNESGDDVWTDLKGNPVVPTFNVRALPANFAARGADGKAVFGARAHIQGTPWMMVLTLPESTVVQRPVAFLHRMLAVGFVLLLIGGLFAWLLSLHVTRPLRTVIDAADGVAAGEYGSRVAVSRRDELGLLGDRFNAMAQRIGDSHAELARRVDESSALTEALQGRNAELRASRDETLRAVQRTERLQAVTASLAGAADVEAVATVILRDGMQAVEAMAGSIFVLNDDGTALELVRAEGYPEEALQGLTSIFLSSSNPLADAARNGAPVYIRSREEWVTRYGCQVPAPVAAFVAWAALPLMALGRPVGVWGLSFAEPQDFDSKTRMLLLALAQQCGQALDRAGLFDAAVKAREAAEDAQRSAQAANDAKSAFLAMMSHELRTPLNAIGGYTELLELGVRGAISDAQRQDLGRIRRNQQHLLSLINDILNLSRIEAGQLSIRLTDLPIDEVMNETEALIAPQVVLRGLRYEVRVEDGNVVVRADREKVQQVLLNLISNAMRFTDPGGTVTIACRAAPDRVLLSVADTGIGIPQEKLEAVFERFVQLDSGLTRRTGGTGLGLAISRDLAHAMGGRLTAASTVGEGSVFTLELPRAFAGQRRIAPNGTPARA